MTQSPSLCPRSEATHTKTVPCGCKVQGLVIRELGGNVGLESSKSSLLPGESQNSCFPGRQLESLRKEHGSRQGPEPLAWDPKCVLHSPHEEEDGRKGDWDSGQ